MISIVPTRLHWIGDDGEDDPQDYCAHSPVDFQVDGRQLVGPDDGDWTVSASAIRLLRSVFSNHKSDLTTEEHVFPCCGHGIWPNKRGGVTISGCPNGVDFAILHQESKIELTMSDGPVRVSYDEWRTAVLDFSTAVRDFYDQSEPKDLSPEMEPEGYIAMIKEWDELIHNAQQTTEAN
ncbi:hypothetical protein [Roseibacillus persicicus]|uniref:Uncharacterized protein n=1 Tax=Roseibacillus persicicus TaxID=454148 RepID=A0A918WQI9_9BACT|nr:hypothetical protein [Roseibacillus persicicus]GHC67809.1 hypothetical protein GCM10007100_39920 [Roseibacillus persicicus]